MQSSKHLHNCPPSVPTARVMFTLVCGDSVLCGEEWTLPSRQTVILNLLTLTGHQDPLLWSRPQCANIVRCHQPLSRPLEIWELIVSRASHWSPVSHSWLLIGSLSPTRDVSRLLSLENVISPQVLATFYIRPAAVKITETFMRIIFGKVFRGLFSGKTTTRWLSLHILVTKRKK